MNIDESEMAPGYCGLLFDETPLLTQAHVRSFVWPILLYRGAVRPHEVVAAVTSVCSTEDLKTGAWDALEGDYSDRSRVEILVDEVLGEMINEGICRYNEERDIWVLNLGENKENLPKIIGIVCSLDGAMPHHLLADMSAADRRRLPVPF
jgi:hypothetical protein